MIYITLGLIVAFGLITLAAFHRLEPETGRFVISKPDDQNVRRAIMAYAILIVFCGAAFVMGPA